MNAGFNTASVFTTVWHGLPYLVRTPADGILNLFDFSSLKVEQHNRRIFMSSSVDTKVGKAPADYWWGI